MGTEDRQWTVAQIGAREHYAVPLSLYRVGRLARFFTDAYCFRACALLGRLPGPPARLSARRAPELPDDRVTAFNLAAVIDGWRPPPGSTEELYDRFSSDGEAFARRVVRALRRHGLSPTRDIFLGFNTGALEALEWLRDLGVFTVVDQVDPGVTQHATLVREVDAWPGWQRRPGVIPERYFQRLRAEWNAADRVVVNSDWSRRALVSQGLAPEKMIVVPCGYDGAIRAQPRPPSTGPLSVLWLGNVNLLKGIQYLVEAARRLLSQRIRFRVVGTLGISSEMVKSAPTNMEFIGAVPRSSVGYWYEQADLFVFPTLSDGFGITQLEAMSHGLPVVATPHCGSVVRHGVDGLLVRAGDADSLAEAIAAVEADRHRLAAMSYQALQRVRDFSFTRTAQALLQAVSG